MRLQERTARLVNKRESKSLILLLELIQRSRTHAALWNFCAEGAEIMRAAGCKPLKREPSEAVSESQNLKRESKSLILSLELTQRADFVTRAYTAC